MRFWEEIAGGARPRTRRLRGGRVIPGWVPVVPARGGMPICMLAPVTGRYLSFSERGGDRPATSAGRRRPGDRSRVGSGSVDDLAGAAPQRGDAERQARVRASIAQWKAERRAATEDREAGHERAAARLRAGPAGRRSVDRTAAAVQRARKWKGRNKPHRGDRRWVKAWSPEQISQRLKVDFPDDESMRISHEAIYQALYVQSRGALKRELVACLRTGRALRVPRARARRRLGASSRPR